MPKAKANIAPINEREIAENLLELGFNPSQKGYHYMIKAVSLRVKDPLGGLYATVYEPIADIYKERPQNIERGIRHAIQCTHNKGNDAWVDLCSDRAKPPNGWAISLIAEIHRLKAAG